MYTKTREVAVVTGVREAHYFILRDKKEEPRKMKFHLDKREYFTGLASLLEVLAEMLENSRKLQKPPTMHHVELLRALREELEFLQENCEMTERD